MEQKEKLKKLNMLALRLKQAQDLSADLVRGSTGLEQADADFIRSNIASALQTSQELREFVVRVKA